MLSSNKHLSITMQKLTFFIIALLVILIGISPIFASRKKREAYENSQRQEINSTRAVGSIKGKVLNKQKQPVGKILVRAEEDGHIQGRLAQTRTNKEGQFALNDLPIGKYLVYGGNEAEGYPESPTSFYQNEWSVQNVEILKDKSISLTLILGKKLGRIAGIVKDTVTRRPITEAIIRIEVLKDRKRYLQTSLDDGATFKIAVPSEPIIFEVFAPGYQTSKQAGNSTGLRIMLGQIKIFNVYLTPSSK